GGSSDQRRRSDATLARRRQSRGKPNHERATSLSAPSAGAVRGYGRTLARPRRSNGGHDGSAIRGRCRRRAPMIAELSYWFVGGWAPLPDPPPCAPGVDPGPPLLWLFMFPIEPVLPLVMSIC